MIPVIAVFDIGKTNKKFFLIDENYQIVHERTTRFDEVLDEDGFPCDDLQKLSGWVRQTIIDLNNETGFIIRAINFSAYGASFVHIDETGAPVTPLYNYLKPYPRELHDKFYRTYGGEKEFSVVTASPVLDNLNSGLQLYFLKYFKANWYNRIHYSLHLPQYISHLVTGRPCSEITSIGCHTGLWDFAKDGYHDWVYAERINGKLPPLWSSDEVSPVKINGTDVPVGVGLHDSSAALIPYLANFSEPFILLSTGTWCITLNPFNPEPLTEEELLQDCLCYKQYNGKPVKASRLFAGNEHEQQVKLLAAHFKLPDAYYEQLHFNTALLELIDTTKEHTFGGSVAPSNFVRRNLTDMATYEIAYHQLIYDIIQQQHKATALVFSGNRPGRIFVDGGFAKNPVYMHLLAAAFPTMEVYAASVSQATAIGAALAIHSSWNNKPVPGDMVQLKYYTVTNK